MAGSLLSVETGIRISNLKPLKPHEDETLNDNDESASNDSQDGGYQPDR